MYVVTVYLWCGDRIEITSRHVEVIIMYAEEQYGEAMAGWDARAA